MSIPLNDLASISNTMLKIGEFPIIQPKTYLKDALESMGEHRLGIVCITDGTGKLAGILTDGDLRRMLLKIQKPFSAFFSDDVIRHSVINPQVVDQSDPLQVAIDIMGLSGLSDIPVVDANQKLVGLLHLHSVANRLLMNAIR